MHDARVASWRSLYSETLQASFPQNQLILLLTGVALLPGLAVWAGSSSDVDHACCLPPELVGGESRVLVCSCQSSTVGTLNKRSSSLIDRAALAFFVRPVEKAVEEQPAGLSAPTKFEHLCPKSELRPLLFARAW